MATPRGRRGGGFGPGEQSARKPSGSARKPSATGGNGSGTARDRSVQPRAAGGPSGSGGGQSGRGAGPSGRGTGQAGRGPRPAGQVGFGNDPFLSPRQQTGLGGEQIEGRQAVRELLSAGKRRVRQLWMVSGNDPAPILDDIERLALEQRVIVRGVSREQLGAQSLTEAPQGVLAIADALPETEFGELLTRRRDGRLPFLLALDGITDPHNLGAILRSAECAGITGVLLPKHRAVHITPTVAKAAAGAIEHVPLCIVPGIPNALLQAKSANAWVVGLDMDGDASIYELAHLHDVPLVLVVGSEGSGMSRLTHERCDVVASIPMRGRLDSLNASAAGGIALFELGRHRNQPNGER